MGKEAKYVVRLTMEERGTLESLVAEGRAAADKLLRARMLLKADVGEGGPGWSDEKIAEAFEVGLSTVHRLRQRLVEDGFEAALVRKPRSRHRAPKTRRRERGAVGGVGVQRSSRRPCTLDVATAGGQTGGTARWWTRSVTKRCACG